MRIGAFFRSVELESFHALVDWAADLRAAGFQSAWLPQSSGYDALTALAVIGDRVDGIELGTAVVPTYPRHPAVMAVQALTTQAAIGGRLALGIGLSHEAYMGPALGVDYVKPIRHMREYLAALLPLAREGTVDFAGETITAHVSTNIVERDRFPVLLAALGPRMLEVAGSLADGTITWMTGPKTVEAHIVPRIAEAAAEAGRPQPRVVVGLPICVGDDAAALHEGAAKAFAGYERPGSYRAMLDREGVDGPGDVAVVGDERSVTEQLEHLESVGATDFMAIPFGDANDRRRTNELLAALAEKP
jgi:F420-dependent oxidoreductase-like protein